MNNLLKRMIEQNPHYGTGDDEDSSVWLGSIPCVMIDAIFWRYRGRRLPGRAKKMLRRYEKRYQKKHDAYIKSLFRSPIPRDYVLVDASFDSSYIRYLD